MGFNSLWLEDAEAPYAYTQGVGIGRAISDLTLTATLQDVGFTGELFGLGPGQLSLVATLADATMVGFMQPGVIVYQAVFDLVNAGLNVFIVRERNDAIPYDYVISWDPPVGTELPPYSEVTLTVSDGPVNAPPQQSAIPNVTGITTSEAVQILFAGGWSAGAYTWAIDASAAGTVIDQFPAAGTLAYPGAVVTLTVSKGPTSTTPPVPVPS